MASGIFVNDSGRILVSLFFWIGKRVTTLLPIFLYHKLAQSLLTMGLARVVTPPAIRGKRLQADLVQVKIGEARVTPQQASQQELGVDLSSLPPEEAGGLRAGVQQLCVLHPIGKLGSFESARAVASNVMPFVLCPRIVAGSEISSVWNTDDMYLMDLTVVLDLTVGGKQQALLFLNERSNNNPVSYIFAAKAREEDTNAVVFEIFNVKEGEYLVQVQIDGAESPLEVDTDSGYIGPVVEIG
jgi:hypothetical protein